MLTLPPIPAWDGLHPLVIHFPIALLLVAPLFVVLGAFLRPERGRNFLIASLLLMVLGTGGILLAVSTGEAAGELAERNGQVEAIIEQHEDLAETSRTVFLALTALLAAILFLPRVFRRPLPRVPQAALLGVFLVAYGAGAILLANTAHQGGRLVHEMGVHALMTPTTGGAGAPNGDKEAAMGSAAAPAGESAEKGEAGEKD